MGGGNLVAGAEFERVFKEYSNSIQKLFKEYSKECCKMHSTTYIERVSSKEYSREYTLNGWNYFGVAKCMLQSTSTSMSGISARGWRFDADLCQGLEIRKAPYSS